MKIFENYAILEGESPALLVEKNSTIDIIADAAAESKITIEAGNFKKEIDFYPWGANNDAPSKLISNAFKNNVVA